MKQSQNTPARALTGKLIAFSVVGAYFAVLFVGGILNGQKLPILSPDLIRYFNPLYYGIAWAVASGLLLLYGSISKPFVYGFTWIAAFAYALQTAILGGNNTLTFAMCGVVALMTVLCGRALRLDPSDGKTQRTAKIWEPSEVSGKVTVAVIAAIAGSIGLAIALTSYLSYASSPAASTGVYAQMMTSLRDSFSFDTTMEFGESVSHFAAHISPIFLVYLPFYFLVPSPVTLYVLQLAAVYSAVIPLWLVAKRKGLSVGARSILCLLFCLFPVIFSGGVGSVHEYALLLPLLLWLIWALEARRTVLVWVFAALVLCVRETAAIHLFTLGIFWWIVNRRSLDTANESHRKERLQALILTAASAVYFVTALILLSTLGRGILITRFSNVTGEYGFFVDSLLREIFCNPALVIYEMLTEAKLQFVLLLLLPLCFLPLRSRKAGLVFLFPLLFLNLLADFSLHYNPDFPYAFGVSAFAFYLAVLAVPGIKARMDGGKVWRRVVVLALCFTAVIGAARLAEYSPLAHYALTDSAEIDAMDALLSSVDDNASVSASARLCPNLAARKGLYTLSQEVDTDIVVIDLRSSWIVSAEDEYTVEYYEKKGYSVLDKQDGVGVILSK